MIAVLKEEYKIADSKGDLIVHLGVGYSFTIINPLYIPKDSDILTRGWQRNLEELSEHYIFYIRGRFIGVPKVLCEIPKTKENGWSANV